jgi:hypothetical protein
MKPHFHPISAFSKLGRELMPHDRTIADSPDGFEATLESSSLTSPVAVTVTGRSAPRTTVLPRIEWSGDAPALVSASRPRFETKQSLGEGGVGEVALAVDQDIGREVAIKRLRSGVSSPTAVARFVDGSARSARSSTPTWCRSTTSASTRAARSTS